MEKTKVTVWCATYNQDKYIEKAIKSFVSQKTSFKFEILIHDDASTDKTKEIIEKYKLKYPHLIKPIYESINQYNKHIDYITNICLPIASGEYIAFCEGDDYWIDDYKLQKQYDFMESNPDVYLCVGKTKCSNEDDSFNSITIPDNETSKKLGKIISSEEFIKLFFEKNRYPFHTSSYFVRRNVIEKNQVYSKLYGYINGDNRIMLSSAAMGDIGYIDSEISNRRLLANGNWNIRFNEKNEDEKLEYHYKEIMGFIHYRELLDNNYSDSINYAVCNYITYLANIFDVSKVSNFYKTIGYIKMPHIGTAKNRIKYMLFCISPNLYKVVHSLVKHKNI